jgi:O-antigen/teichoic acid export membrane protein
LIKGLNIIISLLLVSFSVNYLDIEKYGIWVTISSIIGWVSFFDIGLGNGLRNKFAEAVALGKPKLARTYVSTAYSILSLIVIFAMILFYSINPHLNWSLILNVVSNYQGIENELEILLLIVFTCFCIRLVGQLISIILIANQEPAKASLFNLSANILSLILILLLLRKETESLIYLGTIICSSPIIIFIASSIWLFKGKYKEYAPSFKFIDYKKAKEILNVGFKFFIIQIAVILLYQTNYLIIAHVLNPAMVTQYNIAFRYLSVPLMLFSIFISPFWSAYTDAWVKKDLRWINSAMKKHVVLWLFSLVIVILMVYCSSWIYRLWIGEIVVVSINVTILVGISMLINMWNSIFSSFLNGVGKIKMQIIISITSAIINIPLAIILGALIGIEGILIANITVLIFSSILYPIQFKKLIQNKAQGLWNK